MAKLVRIPSSVFLGIVLIAFIGGNARATDARGSGIDSARIVLGMDHVASWGLGIRGDSGQEYYAGLMFEANISDSYALTGMFLGGWFDNTYTLPERPSIVGFDLALRRYSRFIGFDGWFAGASYFRPSKEEIRGYYLYQTRTELDRISVNIGLFTGLSNITELTLAFRYSLTKRWISDFHYENTSFHAYALVVNLDR
ncbi:MAG: hypothetical protein WC824_14590, partial [Bacteroidota bacterium]